MGLTKSLFHENYYYDSRLDLLYDAEYEEFCFEQQKNEDQKAQRIHSGRSNQHEIRSADTFHALRKPKNN